MDNVSWLTVLEHAKVPVNSSLLFIYGIQSAPNYGFSLSPMNHLERKCRLNVDTHCLALSLFYIFSSFADMIPPSYRVIVSINGCFKRYCNGYVEFVELYGY